MDIGFKIVNSIPEKSLHIRFFNLTLEEEKKGMVDYWQCNIKE
jgi:hypothetical protein